MEEKTISPQIIFAQVSSQDPDTNFGNEELMKIGKNYENGIFRTLTLFYIDCIPKDALITSTNLKIYTTTTVTETKGPFFVNLYKIEEDWSPYTVTWNNQPEFNPNIFGNPVCMKKSGEHCYDITSIVQMSYDQSLSSLGFLLKREEDEVGYTYILTCLKDCNRAVVEIQYILRCECEMKGIHFVERMEEVTVDSNYKFSSVQDTSLMKDGTYFIKNIGIYPMEAKIQNSPNAIDFIDDQGSIVIEPNHLELLIPRFYSKYTRIKVKTMIPNTTSKAEIWYQSQNH